MGLYKHKMERKLKESEQWLATTLKSIGDAVMATDTHGCVIFMNPMAETLTGWKQEDAAGNPLKEVFNIINEETGKRAEDPATRVLREGVVVGLANHTVLIAKDGTKRPIDDSGAPIRDDKGNIMGVVLVFCDISARKRAEEALLESEKKYRALFEESKDVVFISTPEGKFLDINPAGIDLFGYCSKEELLKVSIAKDLYFNPENREIYQRRLEQNGFVKDYEIDMKRKDGEKLVVLVTSTAVRDEKGAVVAYRGMIRDVTEHKKLEQQLLHAQKMEAVGQLAGGVAHDFNNILTVTIGCGNLLKMKMEEDDPLKTYVDQILTSSERAASLTQSLLAFSRKQILNPQPVKINKIVKSVEKLLLRVIGEDIHIQLKTMVTDKDLTVMADSGQIEQVLMNLATNARDAMPKGGLLIIETELVKLSNEYIKTHVYGKPGIYALVSVTDTGLGMDEKTKGKIFEPFFTTKEVGKGTGLGLATVYGIIKQHSGYIDVYSELGKGTTFKIYLPVIKSEAEETKPEVITPLKNGTETVLVAEDETEVRRLIKSMLEEFGYKIIEAVDGEDAIDKFMENKDRIQLLILDVIMPRRNGKEAYEEIKKVRPDIKALFISGYATDIIHEKDILEKKINFISKPILPTELLKKVREVLDK
ncbi:MAG: PAS domain S-box protein [Deltaproteobacteria bacterium]|nr:PAS domain S-box protein [Deltaproteobacteria bacterium]